MMSKDEANINNILTGKKINAQIKTLVNNYEY